MIRKLTLATVAVALLAPLSSVNADGHADPIKQAIDARKAHMKVVGFNMGGLGAMAKGKAPYDADRASAMAMNLALLAKLDTSQMWPAGSDNVARPGETRALPKAWEDYAGVAKAAKDFAAATEVLAAEAGKGKDAMVAAMKGVGKSCGGCHKPYRAPKK